MKKILVKNLPLFAEDIKKEIEKIKWIKKTKTRKWEIDCINVVVYCNDIVNTEELYQQIETLYKIKCIEYMNNSMDSEIAYIQSQTREMEGKKDFLKKSLKKWLT